MTSDYQLFVGGEPADETLAELGLMIEVEENANLPGAIKLSLPVAAHGGDLPLVNDALFGPFSNVAVVATAAGKSPECIFDGFLLNGHLHLETGPTDVRLEVEGQDASWLMNLEERTREWVDGTDADFANTLFTEYDITPAAANLEDESPSHTEAGRSLMQRSTDIQFLSERARRSGKLCRVFCADTPGQRTGWFARPRLDGEPVLTLTLNDLERWTTSALDISWDVTRPSAVHARQKLFSDPDPDGVGVDTADSGLPLLDARGLASFAGREMRVLLTAPVNDAGALALHARSLLAEAGWFARCEGETDVTRLGAVLRVGAIVQVEGVGTLHSGKYFVWSTRHRISQNTHQTRFVLVRNAVGPADGAGTDVAGLVGGLL